MVLCACGSLLSLPQASRVRPPPARHEDMTLLAFRLIVHGASQQRQEARLVAGHNGMGVWLVVTGGGGEGQVLNWCGRGRHQLARRRGLREEDRAWREGWRRGGWGGGGAWAVGPAGLLSKGSRESKTEHE